MRIRLVVQRYGARVAGGAEAYCRRVAHGLADRGHEVEVVTSPADDYLTWEPTGPASIEQDGPVTVRRLAVAAPRDIDAFARLDLRVTGLDRPPAPAVQHEWLRVQGPVLEGLEPALREPTDVSVFFTYLYAPTAFGLPVAAATAPAVLVPTLHDEPPLRLRAFDPAFGHADAIIVSTPEEGELVHRRFSPTAPVELVGIGVPPAAVTVEDAGGHDVPTIVVLGRVDPAKATHEAVRLVAAYRRQRPETPVRLLIVGDRIERLDVPDVEYTGFVTDEGRDRLLAAATVVVQPSYFESFSLALVEAWAMGVPTLCQARCAVTAGQTRRSGGGLTYDDYADFEAALDLLLADPSARRRLGATGRRWVRENYAPDAVLDRFEQVLSRAVSTRSSA